MNIYLRHLLQIHDNIATEGSPKRGQCPTLIQLLQLFKVNVLHRRARRQKGRRIMRGECGEIVRKWEKEKQQ